jgi:hypothetical protein
MSINMVGEYMTAGATRRSSILKDLKRTRPYIPTRYNAAKRIVSESLAGGGAERLADGIADLMMEAATGANAQNAVSCIEAVEAFRRMASSLNLGVTPIIGPHSAPKVELNGVIISCRPELILPLHLTRRRGKRLGLVKLYFGKTHPLSEVAAKSIAAMLILHGRQHLGDFGDPDHSHIYVVDVFAGRVFTADKHNTKRLKDIAAAMVEVAQRWPYI